MKTSSKSMSKKTATVLTASVLALSCMGFALTGCASDADANDNHNNTNNVVNVNDNKNSNTANDNKNANSNANANSNTNSSNMNSNETVDEVTSVHELVYLPTDALDMDSLFEGDGLWGVTIGGSPDVVILHIGEGGILDEMGNQITLADLEPGDIVEASFDIVSMSYPGQVSVDSVTLVGNGGEEAIEPYEDALAELENSMISVDGDEGAQAVQ